ncbi:MAG: hypothetical protein ACKPKO_09430, partial [Candidatus Fonsibacter sp.]
VQTAVSHLHDRRQLQGTGAQGSGLPGRNPHSRLDGDRRGRSIRPRRSNRDSKRAYGNKVAIQFKYCSHQLDLSKRTFREALQKGNHHVIECWINTLYDNYEQTLLRSDKKRT